MCGLEIEHEFVEFIPKELKENKLFISIPYATVVHLCLCGCGERVVTPLSPTDWRFVFDGETISLSPSIGNWSFNCQSHYWIEHSRILWSDRWSKAKIEAGRARDQKVKRSYLGDTPPAPKELIDETNSARSIRGWLRRIARLRQ
jgi:hypothetical protein